MTGPPARVSFDDLTWPLVTQRLTLRRGVPADAPAIFAYRRLPEVGRWLTHIQTDLETWEARWAQRVHDTIVVERGGALIGDTRIIPEDAPASGEVEADAAGTQAELAWAFDPAHHGRGLATEAVEALIAIAFGELGLRRLTAHCYADNQASWRLMERVGMTREGHAVRSCLHRDGTWRDFLAYGRLAPGA